MLYYSMISFIVIYGFYYKEIVFQRQPRQLPHYWLRACRYYKNHLGNKNGSSSAFTEALEVIKK